MTTTHTNNRWSPGPYLIDSAHPRQRADVVGDGDEGGPCQVLFTDAIALLFAHHVAKARNRRMKERERERGKKVNILIEGRDGRKKVRKRNKRERDKVDGKR